MACLSGVENFHNPMRLHAAPGYRSPIAREEEQMQAVEMQP